MLAITGFAFNTLTFGFFYDYFVRLYRMKISENNKTADFPVTANRRSRLLADEIIR
jgi:hypothetical protein